MKILLTGANGYLGINLLQTLLSAGHEVICLVRHEGKLKQKTAPYGDDITILKADLLNEQTLKNIPADIDAAYFLVNTLPSGEFRELEILSAKNFTDSLRKTSCKHIIYLTGIINQPVSDSFTSQVTIENIVKNSGIGYTILRSSIIIGQGNPYFEMMHDLVEKLFVIISSGWVKSKCQPIALRDVIAYLKEILLHPQALNRTFDIGGPDVLTYKKMLAVYARARGLKRSFVTFPVGHPAIASYWLKLVTSVPYDLARGLIDRMHHSMVCSNTDIHKLIPLKLLTYEESLQATPDINFAK